MKIVKVSYTVRPEYAEQNKLNIQKVMNELEQLNDPGIFYHACTGADDKTFIHTAFFQSEEGQKTLNGLEAFKYFIEQLKASGPETPPKQELLTLVGSSRAIF